MLHSVSDFCGEPVDNVEGDLGESRNIDVISLTEVNQGLCSAKKEIADIYRSPLNSCNSCLIEACFEKAFIVVLSEDLFGACARPLEACDSAISVVASSRSYWMLH